MVRYSGSRALTAHDGHAHLFAQLRTRRISQLIGLDSPNGSSISPLPTGTSVPHAVVFFLKLSRAAASRLGLHADSISRRIQAQGMGTLSSSSWCQLKANVAPARTASFRHQRQNY